MFKRFMKIELLTENLLLKSFEKTMFDDFCEFRFESQIIKWTGIDTELSKEQIFNQYFCSDYWAICLKKSNKLIGYIKLYPGNNHMNNTWKMGCVLSPFFRGKGYIDEALNSLFAYAFKNYNLHRITCFCDCENYSSVKMLKRLGFRLEGKYIQCYLLDNQWRDEYYFALLYEDYKSQLRRYKNI